MTEDVRSVQSGGDGGRIFPFLALFLALAGFSDLGAQGVLFDQDVDPRSTFLRPDSADTGTFPALAVDLASLGLVPGQIIEIRARGDFLFAPSATGTPGMNLVGVFSESGVVSPVSSGLLDRVPDSLSSDAPAYVTSPAISPGGAISSATDVDHDFVVTGSGVTITIPSVPGAGSSVAPVLLLGADDVFWQDNSDVEGDFGVVISLQASNSSNRCLRFNPPADQFARTPGLIPLRVFDGFDDFTIEFWFRTDVGASVLQTMVSKWNWPAASWGVGIDGGRVRFSTKSVPNGVIWSPVGVSYADGQWHHLAVTRASSTPSVIDLIVDGAVVATASYSATIDSSVQHLYLGIANAEQFNSTEFEGSLDEIRIWDVGRTVSQIQSDRFRSLSGGEPGLQGYWRLDEGTGQVCANSATMAPPGTSILRGTGLAVESADPAWWFAGAPVSIPFPGTGEDLLLWTGVNAPASPGTPKQAAAHDFLAIEVLTPGGTFWGAPYLLAGEVRPSGLMPVQSALIPGLWLDLSSTFLLVDGTSSAPAGLFEILVPGGVVYGAQIPAGLGGSSLVLQAVAISSLSMNFGLAISDAHLIQIQ